MRWCHKHTIFDTGCCNRQFMVTSCETEHPVTVALRKTVLLAKFHLVWRKLLYFARRRWSFRNAPDTSSLEHLVLHTRAKLPNTQYSKLGFGRRVSFRTRRLTIPLRHWCLSCRMALNKSFSVERAALRQVSK